MMAVWRSLSVAVLVGPRLLALAPVFAIASAQESEINVQKTMRITLGKTSGQPEQAALVPIYFTPPESIAVGRVRLKVTFVSANVKFDKVEAGLAGDNGRLKFSADVTTAKNANGIDTSTVTIPAELSDPSATSISGGLLAYLSLRVGSNARPAMITLTTSAEAFRPGSSDLMPDVRAFGAELGAEGCLFLLHPLKNIC
ncbi:MAG: hypothetical protein EXQ56_05280 [Acidobacteria bacterium]|nr:hypothetical protein [Acidobacteriota bacterium]